VIQLGEMMGQALARRITGVDARAHVIGEFGDLLVAEATAAGTPLVGRTLAESNLRKHTGLNVIGIWKRGQYEIANAATRIDATSVLVLAGSAQQIRSYDELFCIYHVSSGSVIIIGGGRVGRAIARALKEHDVPYHLVARYSDYKPGDARAKRLHAAQGRSRFCPFLRVHGGDDHL